jgi:CTP:molybdopterin cytidylyltransferase MocA
MRGAIREAGLSIGYVITAEEGCLLDADTPADFQKIQEQLSVQSGGDKDR